MAITKRYAHINHETNATQDLLDAASAKISGSMLVGTDVADSKLELTGSLYVSKNAVIKEHLTGTLGALFLNTIQVDQQADMVDVFPQVTDTSDLGSQAKRWDNLFAKTVKAEVLSSSSDADFNGTLHVLGDSTFEAGDVTVTVGDVFVTAGKIETTVGDIIALGGTVSASVALKTNGTLGVHGISTLHGAVIADSTLDVAGNFKVNTDQFIVYAETGNTTINGDLTVNGNVLVDGETFTLDSLQLLVEDKNIILANFTGSGGPTDDTADGGGITISSSLGNKELLWDKSTFTGLAPSFTVNQDWSPSAHLGNSLGQNLQRWQAVYAKTGSFTTVTASAAIKGLTLDVASTSVLRGYAALSGGLGVEGTVSASAAFSGASLDVDSNVDVGGALDVVGNAKMRSELSASSLVVENGATFNGTATFNGDFVVPGQGSFGSLVVGGINMSPISSSSPVSTVDAATGSLLTQSLIDGDMAKYEIEIIAANTDKTTAAAWKISVAALHNGDEIVATETELLKEKIAGLGALLDVDVEIDGNNLVIKAKGAASTGTVYWDCQIVKKMVMAAGTGARKY